MELAVPDLEFETGLAGHLISFRDLELHSEKQHRETWLYSMEPIVLAGVGPNTANQTPN